MGSARWFWIIAVGSRWGVMLRLWHLVEFHWVLLAAGVGFLPMVLVLGPLKSRFICCRRGV